MLRSNWKSNGMCEDVWKAPHRQPFSRANAVPKNCRPFKLGQCRRVVVKRNGYFRAHGRPKLPLVQPCGGGRFEPIADKSLAVFKRPMKMQDFATPNLPSRDFEETSNFYRGLGFVETWRDAGWMILKRGDLVVEFFLHPDFNPDTSAFGSCFRLQDVAAFYHQVVAAGVPERSSGRPSAHPPKREAWGGLVGAVIDPDGSLLRLVQAPN